MTTRPSTSTSRSSPAVALAALLAATLAALVAGAALHRIWPQPVREWVIARLREPAGAPAAPAEHHDHDHATADHDHGHDHDHDHNQKSGPHDHAHDPSDHDTAHGHEGPAAHDEANSLTLSAQARKTIGLTEGEVAVHTFQRTIGVPGMVVERKGRSRFTIIAPLTGTLTKIQATEGAVVTPDQLLFALRLTHEELVQLQADLLKTTAEVDVVRREIARLEGIGPEGLIATKTILERKYEMQKLEAVLESQRQALLLHGLTEAQIDDIVASRRLLHTVVVRAPGRAALPDGTGPDAPLLVQELLVEQGQHVSAGDTLAVLVDHETLLVEGEAFEQDLPQIVAAARERRPVGVVLEARSGPAARIDGLAIASVASRVDPESRALHFYVTLPNERVTAGDGSERFVTWRHKPGQRMQIRVPVEEWTDRIVLPTEAVAQDGVENYVFRIHGDHLDREPVHVEHRDSQWVVIANDGALAPGDRVAMSAAQQLQLAIKNKSGGTIDPHAGHDH